MPLLSLRRLALPVSCLAALLAVVARADASTAGFAPTTTTSQAAMDYNYDRVASNTHDASGSIPRAAVPMKGSAPPNAAQEPGAPFADFLAAKGADEVVDTTGQLHHVVSTRIGRAIERHPNLAGQYSRRDPRLVTRAVNEEAHRGYQTWHRELDAEFETWLLRNPSATKEAFESQLRWRYSQPDLKWRFPNGF